jgi:hypothetical protein
MILSAFRRIIVSPATGHLIILVAMPSIGLDASKQKEGWEKSTVVPDNASCPYFFFNLILLHPQIRLPPELICLQRKVKLHHGRDFREFHNLSR